MCRPLTYDKVLTPNSPSIFNIYLLHSQKQILNFVLKTTKNDKTNENNSTTI